MVLTTDCKADPIGENLVVLVFFLYFFWSRRRKNYVGPSLAGVGQRGKGKSLRHGAFCREVMVKLWSWAKDRAEPKKAGHQPHASCCVAILSDCLCFQREYKLPESRNLKKLLKKC